MHDVRYGLRMLWRSPAVTLVSVVALALGIGANTAIFSVVHTVLVRPLAYEEADRLVFLSERSPRQESLSLSWPNFTDWREQNRSFERFAVYNRDSYHLTGAGEPERLLAAQATAGL